MTRVNRSGVVLVGWVVAGLLSCRSSMPEAETEPLVDTLKSYQAQSGEVISYSESEIMNLRVPVARSAEGGKGIDPVWLDAQLSALGLEMVRIGEGDAGFLRVVPEDSSS